MRRILPAVTEADFEALAEQEELRTALRRALAVVEISFERRSQLEHALEARVAIEQAKGMLAERLRLTPAEAFEVIRGAARSNGLRAHAVATAVLEEPVTPDIVLDALRRHLAHLG
jgi:AmiR/NasT family two-component response regulator